MLYLHYQSVHMQITIICFRNVISTCVPYHSFYNYSFRHTIFNVFAHMYMCVFRYIQVYNKTYYLAWSDFLMQFQFILSNETTSSSSHVDSKSNSFPEAVTCCCTLLYWKMVALVWSTSFYWATTLHDGRYVWENNIPNHQTLR